MSEKTTIMGEYDSLIVTLSKANWIEREMIRSGYVSGAIAVLLILSEDDPPSINELLAEVMALNHAIEDPPPAAKAVPPHLLRKRKKAVA